MRTQLEINPERGAVARPLATVQRAAYHQPPALENNPTRVCGCGGKPGPTGECAQCAAKRLGIEPSASPSVREAIGAAGRPLEDGTRALMEPLFDQDFSHVRIHSDASSADSTRAVNALAYTAGQHIVFAPGQYAPGTDAGRRLLAHELAHVVQQASGSVDGTPAPGGIRLSDPSDRFEREARGWAERVTTGRPVTKPPGPGLSAAPASPPPRRIPVQRGERWDAFWAAGPIDAYRGKQLALEAEARAISSGLPGLRNGPADAWRHAYWNCRMTAVIGAEDAEDIATIHEDNAGGPAIENKMDLHNNDVGRSCKPDCDTCVQGKLDSGQLKVISGGKLVNSSPTARKPLGAGKGDYDKY